MDTSSQSLHASIIVVAGFLGSGKTTFATNLIKALWDMGHGAALITNDQSTGLVDTELAVSGGIAVSEISGGCFCCRCHEFALALDEIVALREADIIVAEAVGSCTDLVATVVEPLRIDLKRNYRVFPVTVLVDPTRAEAILLGHPGQNHNTLKDDVTYIFIKQLEEAQIILVNKADSLPSHRMDRITLAIKARFPEAHVIKFSAQDSSDIQEYWNYLRVAETKHRPIQKIDYDRYARGEAILGWLNAECRIEALQHLPTMDALSDAIGEEIHKLQVKVGVEIVHLKVSVVDPAEDPRDGKNKRISVVQCVSSDAVLDSVRRSPTLISQGIVLINLRAQAEPEILEREVRAALDAIRLRLSVAVDIVRLNSFAPGAPDPQYQRR